MFLFAPESNVEYEAEAVITVPSAAGTPMSDSALTTRLPTGMALMDDTSYSAMSPGIEP